ncbi:hypothetical protein DUNSADRAFT_17674 [Dunaliella salina]|uniref:Encoded protein n=1 Tax=Dunaliella salina TaxID=3046 RepID=A0ABQ7G1A7_DUNSA|nr:hypothetical protein DUNSADRAFT_17674 [Dunaliella salina]|eukprot:KAF5828388.1 hypothetical protein DUNSADRAFT_17674 [Dunaliella salina]
MARGRKRSSGTKEYWCLCKVCFPIGTRQNAEFGPHAIRTYAFDTCVDHCHKSGSVWREVGAAGLSSALVTSRGGGGSISAPSAASTQEDVHVRSVGKRLRGPAYTIINAEADDCRRKRLHWSALSVPVAKDGRVRTQPVGTLNRAAAGGQKTWVKTSEV